MPFELFACCAVFCRDKQKDLDAMLAALRKERYSALVLDAHVLEYVTGHNEDCDLFLVGETFESFSLALAFPPAFPDQDVFSFSRSIVKLQVSLGTSGPR